MEDGPATMRAAWYHFPEVPNRRGFMSTVTIVRRIVYLDPRGAA
jgi:hypothetical protein